MYGEASEPRLQVPGRQPRFQGLVLWQTQGPPSLSQQLPSPSLTPPPLQLCQLPESAIKPRREAELSPRAQATHLKDGARAVLIILALLLTQARVSPTGA